MSVFGVDLGALNSVIAVTRQGGIDVICNEVSKRDTATFVSYMGDERLIGEAGFDKAVRNPNYTIPCVKRLIGMRKGDPRLEKELRFVHCNTSFDNEGRLVFDVDYNEQELQLYPEQILAAFLGKLKKYVVIETKTESKDCVVSVPVWFTAEQRRLVIQACEIAGLHNLSLINETTAASVDYGIFRVASLPDKEDEAHAVAIIDFGYAGCTVTISRFWKGNMRVLSHAWDHELGTREIDWLLYTHFATEIKNKYKVDVTENKRARIRLLQGVDKLKCMLSANAVAPLNIENLMDVDVALLFEREALEKVIEPLVAKVRALAEKALARAGLAHGSLNAVEVIGGGSRIPSFKNAVSEAFGVQASFTLNASESIARGCAITAATFSPLFQVREYIVNEAPLCPLMLGYHSDKVEAGSSVSFLPNVNKTMALLRDTDRFPKTLELTFNRSDEFDLFAFYDENSEDAKHVAAGPRSVIGHWTVGSVKNGSGSVKVRVKFHASGLVTIDGASTSETYEKEVVEDVKPAEKKPVDPAAEGETPTDAPAADAPKTQKVMKQFSRKVELSVTPKLVVGHAAEVVLAAKKTEAEQDTRDLTIQRTREVRNELEGYVYDNRARVRDGDLAPFVTDADRATFIGLADEFEQWLYGDGDNAALNEYQTRLDKLKVIGAACIRRLRLSEDIPFTHAAFEKRVAAAKDLAAAKIGAAAHITEEELRSAMSKCDEAVAWGQKELDAYRAKPKHEDPSLAPSTFDNKAKEVEATVKAVVNKKAPPPPKKEEKKDEKKDDDKADTPQPASPTSEESKKGPDAPADLD